MLKLWYGNLNASVRIVRLMFWEMEVDVAEERVDLQDGKIPAILERLNIWRLPTLQIPEAPGFLYLPPDMAEYLSKQAPPERRLVPWEAESGFQVRRWCQYVARLVGSPLNDWHRGQSTGPASWLESSLSTLEAKLGDEVYLVDERFSLADCVLGVCLMHYQQRVELTPRYPALSAYLQRLMQRPSFGRL